MFRYMYIFLAVFPFLVVPIDQYVTVVKMGLFVYLCLAIWIFIFLKSYRRKEFQIKGQLYLPEILLLMFGFWIMLSTVLSDHPYIALFGMIKRHEGLLTLYSYFTVFFIACRYTPIEKYKYWLTVLVSISMIPCIYGLLQKSPLPFLSFIDGTGRVESFFGNPNFYGSYLVIMLSLAIILTLLTKEKKKTILCLVATNFLLLNMLYSGTRSAFVGIFVGLVFFSPFIWINFSNLRKRYAGLLITFLVLFITVNVIESNAYSQRVISIVDSAEEAIRSSEESGHAGSGRWKLWELALPLVGKYPIFGSGPDTLSYVYDNDAFCEFVGLVDCTVDKAHNEYLQIAITMGIPALIFYLAFLCSVFWAIWKSLRKSSGEKQLMLAGFLALLLGYTAQAFFNISVVPVAPYFWLMLGMAYRLAKEESFLAKNESIN